MSKAAKEDEGRAQNISSRLASSTDSNRGSSVWPSARGHTLHRQTGSNENACLCHVCVKRQKVSAASLRGEGTGQQAAREKESRAKKGPGRRHYHPRQCCFLPPSLVNNLPCQGPSQKDLAARNKCRRRSKAVDRLFHSLLPRRQIYLE